MHRSPFSAVEYAELNSGPINRLTHQTTESIDLANNLAFRHSAYGRIAAHLSHGIKITGQQCDARAHSGSRISRFRTRMPGSDNKDIVFVSIHFCDNLPHSITTTSLTDYVISRTRNWRGKNVDQPTISSMETARCSFAER